MNINGLIDFLPEIKISNSSTTTPVKLGSESIVFTSITFVGNKPATAPTRAANTGTVWIQFSSVDGAPAIPLLPGEVKTFNCPPGRVANAGQFWLDVDTANDGVIAFPMI